MIRTACISYIGSLLLLLGLTGCSPQEQGQLRIDLGKSSADRLLQFYFGAYAGSDPFEAGLLERDGTTVFLNTAALQALHPSASPTDANGDGTLDWDELVPFFQSTYYTARNLPPTLAAFKEAVPYGGAPWFTVELDGVMTTARRHIFIEKEALRAALRGYTAAGQQLMYPVGTTVVGEHRRGETVVEVTVMQKRGDGFWDFFTYGPDGRLAPATQAAPRALKSPVQCVGCHLGTRQFEPEKSFPAPAPDGPHGPRAVHVPPSLRNADVVAYFDEHRKRSDTVLGVYNTLFVSGLLQAPSLTDADRVLLQALPRLPR